MFCKNCGSKIRDDAKFCPSCGAQVSSAGTPRPQPQEEPAGQPAGQSSAPAAGQSLQPSASTAVLNREPILGGGRKRRGLGLVIGAAVAAVVVCAAVVVLLTSVLGGPKDKVAKAFDKTLSAYSQSLKDAGLPDLAAIRERKAASVDLSLELNDIPSLSYYGLMDLDGIGMRLGWDYSLSDRAAALSAAAYYGSADLLSGSIALDDTVLTVYAPDFMGDTALGLDTATLGADLVNLDLGIDSDFETISFNVFDLIEVLSETPEVDTAAVKALVDAIEVEEAGTESVEVNGKSVECRAYSVLIPEDAMRDYIDAMEDAADAAAVDEKLAAVLGDMGFPEEVLDALEDELRNSMSTKEMFDVLTEAVKAIGDIEAMVYVDGGYLMAVTWEPRIEGTRVEIGAYFGGGSRYMDDLSLVVEAAGGELLLESTGDHSADSGTFTDTTTLRLRSAGETVMELESELEYEPGADVDNFAWSLSGEGVSLEAEGQLTVSGESFDLALEDVSLQEAGEEVLSLALQYSVKPYEKRDTGAQETRMLSEMTYDDLEDLVMDIEDNAMDWSEALYDLLM